MPKQHTGQFFVDGQINLKGPVYEAERLLELQLILIQELYLNGIKTI